MATLELKLTVPDGTKVTIFGAEGATIVPDDAAREDNIERYWRDYLSDNARKVFGAAAASRLSAGLVTRSRTSPRT